VNRQKKTIVLKDGIVEIGLLVLSKEVKQGLAQI